MSKDFPTLADLVLSETYAQPRLKPYRDRMLRARRFVLSDEMSSFMADLAHAAFMLHGKAEVVEGATYYKTHSTRAQQQSMLRTLDGARTLARAPLDVTWIEFNVHARSERQRQEYMHNPYANDEVKAMRAGWLIEKLHGGDLVRATTAFEIKRTGRAVIAPFSWEWSPTGVMEPRSKKLLTNEGNYDEEEFEMLEAICHVGFAHYKSKLVATVCNDLTNYFDKGVVKGFLNEVQGELRYVWTTLSTINDVPAKRADVVPSRGFMAKGHGYRKFMSHSIVTIEIPKTKDVRKLARRIVAVSRQRRHEVRGHWRRFGIEKLRKWVEDYCKGDAALGWVHKDYAVKRAEEKE